MHAAILHTVGGGNAVTRTDEASSTDERISAAGSTSLDLGVPRPRVRLGLDAADYSHEDVRLNCGDAALAVVFTVVVVKYLYSSPHCESIRYCVLWKHKSARCHPLSERHSICCMATGESTFLEQRLSGRAEILKWL